MTCSICNKPGARRSRRQTVADHLISVFGIYPWRCSECHSRFRSRLMPLSYSFRAHCPFCGNLELRRIAPEFVDSPFAALWKILRIPALRCDPCRYKYFSLLPLRETEERVYHTSIGD